MEQRWSNGWSNGWSNDGGTMEWPDLLRPERRGESTAGSSSSLEDPRLWKPSCHQWPEPLRWIARPPQELWICGNKPMGRPIIAIVGSRKASVAGLRWTFQLAAELSRSGFRIVSGLALGIDAAALDGALLGCEEAKRSAAPTMTPSLAPAPFAPPMALLGNGLPAIYPAKNRPLARRIVQCGGALISEYPPGTAPRPHHFPHRNRLISGCSVAVVVVEATLRSGSMGTARHALDQGCEVCAVPGPVESTSHQGCHLLIRDGAHLVTCARDIIEVCAGLGVAGCRAGIEGTARKGLSADQRRLERERKLHGDDLCRLHEVTGWSPIRLLRAWSGGAFD
ncbi:MAG TPA: DNA-processing protein DprA [Planctomycetes bacterium]|nr:DNA-processing protein DprA [Planctomycetota bacterium]HIK82872.1 DNA-processing protein DprA [Planctomycetota bacterium]